MKDERKTFISFRAFTVNTIGGRISPPPMCNRVKSLSMFDLAWTKGDEFTNLESKKVQLSLSFNYINKIEKIGKNHNPNLSCGGSLGLWGAAEACWEPQGGAVGHRGPEGLQEATGGCRGPWQRRERARRATRSCMGLRGATRGHSRLR
jgi:hypothetical protein